MVVGFCDHWYYFLFHGGYPYVGDMLCLIAAAGERKTSSSVSPAVSNKTVASTGYIPPHARQQRQRVPVSEEEADREIRHRRQEEDDKTDEEIAQTVKGHLVQMLEGDKLCLIAAARERKTSSTVSRTGYIPPLARQRQRVPTSAEEADREIRRRQEEDDDTNAEIAQTVEGHLVQMLEAG
jgi:hypothetical protein